MLQFRHETKNNIQLRNLKWKIENYQHSKIENMKLSAVEAEINFECVGTVENALIAASVNYLEKV